MEGKRKDGAGRVRGVEGGARIWILASESRDSLAALGVGRVALGAEGGVEGGLRSL